MAVCLMLMLAGRVEAAGGCRSPACERRVTKRHWRAVVAPYRAKLLRVAQCESTGRWHIVNPPYSGGLQFQATSWAAVGGRGLAADASPLEQMFRAVRLMRLQGWGAWPVCGRR